MTRIRQREDTAAGWAASNPVLLAGEWGWETDVVPIKGKKGDGVTAWNSLPYGIDPIGLNSPVFTGDPKAPTPATGDNDTSIATTAFVKAQQYAPFVSPAFTGSPTAPTPLTADNDTSIATTAFVKAQGYAPLASPTFTGVPAAPTPSPGDNDTSIATTAFVTAAIAAAVAAAMLAENPVGSIRMQTVATNPSTFIGGTWVAWGTGRVPVGIDAGQTEFDTVEETGGAKTHTLALTEMPVHNHTVPTALTDTGAGSATIQRIDMAAGDRSFNGTAGGTSDAGSGAPHNNLQPYIVCYMFKRTA